ncbi:MAG: hypothetical protein NUV77_20030, partial [Thermoguttaceae bacterium]|nr:hypothetical protein [Thermoguttaceae bacterium]
MKAAMKAFCATSRHARAGLAGRRLWIVVAAAAVGLAGAAVVASGGGPPSASRVDTADPVEFDSSASGLAPPRYPDDPPPDESPAPIRLAANAPLAEAPAAPASPAPAALPPATQAAAPKSPPAGSKSSTRAGGRLSLPLLKAPSGAAPVNPLKIPLAGAPPADRVAIQGS